MKVLLVMATWLCCATIIFPAFVAPSSSSSTTEQQQTATNTLRYNTVTFNLAQPNTYSTFMTSLRTQLSGTNACQIPVTRTTAPDLQRFVLVDLKTTSQKTITLAIDVTSVYVVAYRDKLSGKDRANFLSDAPTVAKNNLFKGATVRNIAFGGSYIALEKAAKQGRNAVELGVNKLEFLIESVFGKNPMNGQLEAKFLLIAIQMISEAARFKYIESKVTEKGLHGSFKPDPKVLNLENKWGKISQEIHKTVGAKPACSNISPAIMLQNADGSQWKVDKVSTVKSDLGIIKFKDAKLAIRITSYFTQIVRAIVGEDGALFAN